MHETVADRYELLERVGSGGTAEVWRARDRRTGDEVALKRLHAEVAADPAARARFRREIAAAAAVRHPNAVSVVDSHEDDRDGGPWLVMAHVPGGSLTVRLRTHDLAPAAATRVAADIANALAALHAAGFVHRDVTPGNILLGRAGRAYLADFGLARRIDDPTEAEASVDLTAPQDVVGTLRFIAPEVLAGERATPASDVWALGAVLYEALAGAPPFDASSPAALLAAQRAGPAPALGMDGRVAALVARMLAAAAASRPAATAVSSELRRAADVPVADPDDRTAVRPLPLAASAARPSEARVPVGPARLGVDRAPALLAAGLAALLVVALVAGWSGGQAGGAAEATGRPTPIVGSTEGPPTEAPDATTAPVEAAPNGDGAGGGGQGGGKDKGDNPGKGKGRGLDG